MTVLKAMPPLALFIAVTIWRSTASLFGAGEDLSQQKPAAAPEFGPNVVIFDPSMTNIQSRLDSIFNQQERSQFGSNRYAYFFKPRKYNLDVQVGFYTRRLGWANRPTRL